MELLAIFLGIIITFIMLKVTNKAIGHFEKKSLTKANSHARKILQIASGEPELDDEGFAVKYDAHYTRDLEIAGGVKVETQCDDTNCKKCYWKPRMLKRQEPLFSNVVYGTAQLLRKRDDFINSLPDGYSDDLYDMFYKDWLEEIRPEVNKTLEQQKKNMELEQRRKEEKYYATPYDQIQKYKKEGRTFNKVNNSWSGIPKDNASRSMVIDNDMSVSEWLVEAERLKKQMSMHGAKNSNSVVDMKVEYEWDLKTGKYYRTLISIHKNGGRSFKKEEVSKTEFGEHGGRKSTMTNKEFNDSLDRIANNLKRIEEKMQKYEAQYGKRNKSI